MIWELGNKVKDFRGDIGVVVKIESKKGGWRNKYLVKYGKDHLRWRGEFQMEKAKPIEILTASHTRIV